PQELGADPRRPQQGAPAAQLRPRRASRRRSRPLLFRRSPVRQGAEDDPPGKRGTVPPDRAGPPARSFMTPLPLQPLSPLDGRYRAAVSDLGEHLSEAGLNRARVQVEVEWLIFLTERSLFGSTPLADEQKAALRAVVTDFDQEAIDALAREEAVTRHDVKAVEYYVRAQLTRLGLDSIAELTHFACTSEDINNLSYALTVRAAVEGVWMPRLTTLVDTLSARAEQHRDVPMLALTHGQPATPTTMGKELAVFVHRLRRVIRRIEA